MISNKKWNPVIDLSNHTEVPVYFLMWKLIKMGFKVEEKVGISRLTIWSDCDWEVANTLLEMMYNDMKWEKINNDHYEDKVKNFLHCELI